MGVPRLLLRLEGLVLFAGATWAFSHTGMPWWLYAVLFFVPDFSFAAYGAGPKLGAIVYNALHSTIGPALLGLTGFELDYPSILGVSAIWAAHVGFDRLVGYGLKYATGFNDTHLGRIGRNPAGV